MIHCELFKEAHKLRRIADSKQILKRDAKRITKVTDRYSEQRKHHRFHQCEKTELNTELIFKDRPS